MGQAGPGGREPQGRRAADRPRLSPQAEERRRPWRDRALEAPTIWEAADRPKFDAGYALKSDAKANLVGGPHRAISGR